MSYYGNPNQTIYLYRRLKAGTAWRSNLLTRIGDVRSFVTVLGTTLQQNFNDIFFSGQMISSTVSESDAWQNTLYYMGLGVTTPDLTPYTYLQALTASTSSGGLFDNLTSHIQKNLDNLARNVSLVDSAVHEYLAMGDVDRTEQLTANVFGLLLGSAMVMLDQCLALAVLIQGKIQGGQPVIESLGQLMQILGDLGAAIAAEELALKGIISDLSDATDAATLPSLYNNSPVGKTVLDVISQDDTKTILEADEDQSSESDSDKMSEPGAPDQVFSAPSPITPRPIDPLPELK